MDYSDVKIHTRDYNVKLHGETDISKAVEMMLVNFKVFFEEELTSLLASRLLHTTKEALNAKLGIDIRDRGDFNVNNGSGPFISKKMLVDPIFDSHYVAFVLDGTYVGGGDHYE